MTTEQKRSVNQAIKQAQSMRIVVNIDSTILSRRNTVSRYYLGMSLLLSRAADGSHGTTQILLRINLV